MLKQAACYPCRRSKTKCCWVAEQHRCRRCIQIGHECVRGAIHSGRLKGTKNKRSGLDKALFQVEQVVQRLRRGNERTAGDDAVARRLHRLLREMTEVEAVPSNIGGSSLAMNDEDDLSEDDSDEATADPADDRGVESAESPLHLLALSHRSSGCRKKAARTYTSSGLGTFFAPAKVSLDVGDDLDPISLGLATEDEANALLSLFHTSLAHTRWGLDPKLYDLAFTRSRSAFLLTSIMAASALFMPTGGALSKRLSSHVRFLANHVISHKHKSVEIVLAFLVNVPWMPPGKQSMDDETCFYIATATNIAIDLALHKALVFEDDAPLKRPATKLGRGDWLDARAALAMDGFPSLDPSSQRARLLLRSRERCWISLFALERGMCLARGRPSTVPITRLLRSCDGWHCSDLADTQDGHVLSVATLRRDLDGLLERIRSFCDASEVSTGDGSPEAQSIQAAIDQFFHQWHCEYDGSISTGPYHQLPPYIDILLTHTRLSIYGSLINHPTAPVAVRYFFRTAGLASSLNVMRAAIHGESRLMSMPNNTAIMISFAACFALTLSRRGSAHSTLASGIAELVDGTAGVLERIGSITPHRNAPSILYSKQLRQALRSHLDDGLVETTAPAPSILPTTQPVLQSDTTQQPSDNPETYQFSTMTDVEIAQALEGPDPPLDGWSWDGSSNFDWLQWPDVI